MAYIEPLSYQTALQQPAYVWSFDVYPTVKQCKGQILCLSMIYHVAGTHAMDLKSW